MDFSLFLIFVDTMTMQDNEISLHKVTASKDKIIAELEDRM